jgi:hypothetical protein
MARKKLGSASAAVLARSVSEMKKVCNAEKF